MPFAIRCTAKKRMRPEVVKKGVLNKPGSVPMAVGCAKHTFSHHGMEAIYLGCMLPCTSSASYPSGGARLDPIMPPYLDLLRMGLAMPMLSPALRWALTLQVRLLPNRTPTFSPLPAFAWRLPMATIKRAFGGIFSVALILGVTPTGR